MFGAIILVNKALVVTRNNGGFVESVFPFKEKKSSFKNWESLHKILGRNNDAQEKHNFDDLLPFESIVEPTDTVHIHTKHSLVHLRLPVHMMTILSTSHQMMKMSKICLSNLLTTSRPVQFLHSILYQNLPFESPMNDPLQFNTLWTMYQQVMGGC